MLGHSLFPNKNVTRSEPGGHAGEVRETGGEEEQKEEERKTGCSDVTCKRGNMTSCSQACVGSVCLAFLGMKLFVGS